MKTLPYLLITGRLETTWSYLCLFTVVYHVLYMNRYLSWVTSLFMLHVNHCLKHETWNQLTLISTSSWAIPYYLMQNSVQLTQSVHICMTRNHNSVRLYKERGTLSGIFNVTGKLESNFNFDSLSNLKGGCPDSLFLCSS